MRRALRRAALALLTAGAPGWGGLAVAQQPPAAAPMAMPPADTAHESRCRLEEMKVEMAWLANPATFPYPMAARTVDGELEVRGEVPNEAVRLMALRIAKAHARFPIVDALQINRKLPARATEVAADAVRQGAVEVLTETFGMAARGFEIRAESDGQVAVSGSVSSVEEKLAVSRRLRKVRGCTSASNYLQISPVMRDGRMVTQINLNGSLVVSGQVLCLDGTGQESSSPRPPATTSTVSPPIRSMVVAPTPAPVIVSTQQRATPVVGMPPPPPPMPPVVRTTTVQVPPAPPPVQPVVPASAPPVSVPSAVMPIELPIPPAPPARTLMAPPAPSRVADAPEILVVPGPLHQVSPDVKPKSVPPLPAVPSPGSAVQLPRDPSSARQGTPMPVTVKSVTPPKQGQKDMDLLAAPTVPQSWTRDTANPAPVVKQKSTAPTNFATTRQGSTKPLSPDDLLNLPAVPLTAAGKPKDTVISTPAPVHPVTVNLRTLEISPVVPPVPVPPPAAVATKAPVTGVVVLQSKPAPVPAPASAVPQPVSPPTLKPLPAAAPTAFKPGWVDALPAPKPVETPGHPLPPPGGWPVAHISRPAPTAYVTSGVVIFPDDHVPSAKPALVVTREEPAPAPKPVTVVASRLEPVEAPPVPVRTITPVSAPPAPTPVHATPPSAAALKARVEKVCGRQARQVEVIATENGFTVRVKCSDDATAQKITERVLVQVPEMADAKVKFEVSVGP
jgi:hypothetical protein